MSGDEKTYIENYMKSGPSAETGAAKISGEKTMIQAIISILKYLRKKPVSRLLFHRFSMIEKR